jgi:cyclic-di-GMP-binding protein
MQNSNPSYLNIPKQSLSTLTFCDPTAKQIKAWVESLPMANIGETSRQLYHAVIEFNQLNIPDASRLELMDLVRGPIHFICGQLNQRYLNQTVVLDERQRKVANLAQALQTHLAVGYKIIIQHTLNQNSTRHKALLGKAIHRTMHELMPAVLRSYQLYIQTPRGIWQEIHQLYQIASSFNIQYEVINDPVENTHLSIQHAYIKTILLGACQPNQLLQRELNEAFETLGPWATHLKIDEVANEKSVLIINPETDGAPQYRYLVQTSNVSDYIGINTLSLVHKLHNDHKALSAEDRTVKSLIVPDDFSLSLLKHLIQAWGGMKQRSFSRTPAGGNVRIAVGLTATHHHISGGVSFYSQLYGSSASTPSQNPFTGETGKRFVASDTQAVRASHDVWEDAYDVDHQVSGLASDGIEFSKEANSSEQPPSYQGQLVNVSPRGYCIQWSESPAPNLKTGEVIAIKEEKLQHWNLGIVRWIRQGAEYGAQIGVELLAPNSRSCGIRQLHKTGVPGDYLRALYIPEIRAIGQDASVITSLRPFNIGNKVSINLDGIDTKFQLTKRVTSTGIISQFQIRPVAKKPLENTRSKTTDETDDFDNLWRQL